MTREELIQYWVKTAEDDYVSMQRVFSAGEYVWALFIGHLVIEKLLKAHCARFLGQDVPRTHNLLRLARLAEIEPTPDEKKMLSQLNLFNVRARYSDWKNEFRRTADREYAEKHVHVIGDLREWLLRLLSERSNP